MQSHFWVEVVHCDARDHLPLEFCINVPVPVILGLFLKNLLLIDDLLFKNGWSHSSQGVLDRLVDLFNFHFFITRLNQTAFHQLFVKYTHFLLWLPPRLQILLVMLFRVPGRRIVRFGGGVV